MFNKSANTPPPRPQAAPAPTDSQQPVRRQGVIKGEVSVARLVIGERATVEGSIRGGAVEVRGKVMGNIEAKAVKLYESAHVEGDIVHEQLSIDVGAFFQGRCQQARPAPVVAPPPVAAVPPPAPQPSPKVVELEQAKG
ncbi:MAG: hypothetical protein B7Y99_10135 [Caulobacterales bacterium 32-69-10]|nr:MAG: hypothetical protein B7Y99_10135 [Caulobacterales bacterium 32-69-10]